MRTQCVTCGGIFDALSPAGTVYYHACPPLSRRELAAAVAASTVRLRPGETVDDAYARRLFPRPNRRDENIDRAKVATARRQDGTFRPGQTAEDVIKAPGGGVVAAAAEPIDAV